MSEPSFAQILAIPEEWQGEPERYIMRGEPEGATSGDMERGEEASGAGAGEGEAMAEMNRSREGPAWLESFLKPIYFAPCNKHTGPGRAERNHFCLDCVEGPLCSAGLLTHAGHSTLQARKASYKDVVRLQDVQLYLNMDDIMIYNINSSRIVFLHSRPQEKSTREYLRCIMCRREFANPVSFCSMQCKLDAIRSRPDDTSATFFKAGVEVAAAAGEGCRGDSCSHEPSGDAAGRTLVSPRAKVGGSRRSSSSGSVQKNAGRRKGGRDRESEVELVEVEVEVPPARSAAAAAAAKKPPRAPAEKRRRMPQKKIAVAAAAAEPHATAAAALDSAIDTAAVEAAAGALAAATVDVERERELANSTEAVERQRGTVRKRPEAMKPPPPPLPLLPRKRNARVQEEEECGFGSGSDGGGRRSASPGSTPRVVRGMRSKSPAFSPTSVLAVPPWSRGADPPLPPSEMEQPEEIVQTPPAVERRGTRRKPTAPHRSHFM